MAVLGGCLFATLFANGADVQAKKVKVAKPVVSASNATFNSITLSMDSSNPKTKQTGYIIYKGKKKVYTLKESDGYATVKYKQTGLKKNKSYTFKVKTYRVYKKKKYYSATVKIKAKTLKKIKLQKITAKPLKQLSSSITMKLTGVNNADTVVKGIKYSKIDGFVVWRGTKLTNMKKIKTVKVECGEVVPDVWTDTTVKCGTYYYYRFRSFRIVEGKKYWSEETFGNRINSGWGNDDVLDKFTGFTEEEENADFERKMLEKINIFRKREGIPEMKLNQDLCNLALIRAKALANGEIVGHEKSDEYFEDYFSKVYDGKYKDCFNSENLTWGDYNDSLTLMPTTSDEKNIMVDGWHWMKHLIILILFGVITIMVNILCQHR